MRKEMISYGHFRTEKMYPFVTDSLCAETVDIGDLRYFSCDFMILFCILHIQASANSLVLCIPQIPACVAWLVLSPDRAAKQHHCFDFSFPATKKVRSQFENEDALGSVYLHFLVCF